MYSCLAKNVPTLKYGMCYISTILMGGAANAHLQHQYIGGQWLHLYIGVPGGRRFCGYVYSVPILLTVIEQS